MLLTDSEIDRQRAESDARQPVENELFSLRRDVADIDRLLRGDMLFHFVLLGLFLAVMVVAVATSYR